MHSSKCILDFTPVLSLCANLVSIVACSWGQIVTRNTHQFFSFQGPSLLRFDSKLHEQTLCRSEQQRPDQRLIACCHPWVALALSWFRLHFSLPSCRFVRRELTQPEGAAEDQKQRQHGRQYQAAAAGFGPERDHGRHTHPHPLPVPSSVLASLLLHFRGCAHGRAGTL